MLMSLTTCWPTTWSRHW